MASAIYRGQRVIYWPLFIIDPPTDGNGCIGMVTQIDDADVGIVRIGGFSNEGRSVPEGQQCTLGSTPTIGGWMPLEV